MVVVYRDGAWYPEMPPSPPETVATLPGHRRCHPETLPSRDHLRKVVSRDGPFSSRDGGCHLGTPSRSPGKSPSRHHLGRVVSRDGPLSSCDGGNRLETVLHPPEMPASRDDAGRMVSRDGPLSSRDGGSPVETVHPSRETPPSRYHLGTTSGGQHLGTVSLSLVPRRWQPSRDGTALSREPPPSRYSLGTVSGGRHLGMVPSRPETLS